MVATRQFNPLMRAILVIGAVMVLVTGVTLAALRDTVAIEGNTIASANADLKIWNGSEWSESTEGFAVTGLIPGEGSDEYNFYLQNNGDTDLDIAASVPSAPGVPEGEDGYDFVGWENLKVTFTSYAPDCEEGPVTTDMAALLAGEVELPCNPLNDGATGNGSEGAEETEGNYSVSFDIDPASVTGDNPGVGSFDLILSGTAVSVPEVD